MGGAQAGLTQSPSITLGAAPSLRSLGCAMGLFDGQSVTASDGGSVGWFTNERPWSGRGASPQQMTRSRLCNPDG